MHEISPVLSGKFDAADYTPAVTNFNRAADTASSDAPALPSTTSVSGVADTSDTAATDPRRYTKFDRTASQMPDAPDFSFNDFLDMINPLQHIPLVSSVYRAATGETINPVARVAGDIMYGSAIGAISAVVSGAGAVADAVNESQTGHDKTGAVLANLFGVGDSKSGTEIAGATESTPSATLAPSLSALAAHVPSQALSPSVPQTESQNLTLASTAASRSVTPAPTTDQNVPLFQAKVFPLNRQAYGGALAPTVSMEDQNRVIALSQGSHAMRLGNTIYTSPLMNGPHPMPVAVSPAPTSTATTDATSAASFAGEVTNLSAAPTATTSVATPAATQATTTNNVTEAASSTNGGFGPMSQHSPLPQNLIDDLVMMKAINQYKGVAAGPSSVGSSLDMSN